MRVLAVVVSSRAQQALPERWNLKHQDGLEDPQGLLLIPDILNRELRTRHLKAWPGLDFTRSETPKLDQCARSPVSGKPAPLKKPTGFGGGGRVGRRARL